MMLKDMTKKAGVLSALNCRTLTMSFFPGASVLWTVSQARWNRQRFMFPSTADLGALGSFNDILGVTKKPC